MTDPETILELNGICKRFGDIEALKGVDLAVRKGEFFGFLGPNGAGKSTLMKIFSGFLGADSGRVLIKGREVGVLSLIAAVILSISLWRFKRGDLFR